MNLKALTSAILLASLPTTGVFAAAMDRSGQSISAFLQPGNYFEAGISALDANVSGKIQDNFEPGGGTPSKGASLQGTDLSDMADSYYFPNAALKVQLNENFSFGLIYDQPFGAKAKYSTTDAIQKGAVNLNNDVVGAFYNNGEATEVDVKTQNLSLIFGFQPTENWNIYAGPVYQTVEGEVKLRGSAYGPFGAVNCNTPTCQTGFKDEAGKEKSRGYDAKISEDSAVGWLAGVAYQIPEIALKASLTYRAEIKHSVDVQESMMTHTTLGFALPIFKPNYAYKEASTDVTTPQSVNLDLQTGIMANTVAFAQLRWVDWSEFKIRPNKFGQMASALTQYAAKTDRGFDLVAYEKDQISANIGIGRKFNDQWAGTAMVGWDSGAGNPVSTLGPTEGYWSVGLGGQFSPTPQTFVQAGVKYFWLGDAKSQIASHFGTDEYAANFEDNDAIGYSLKLGYRF